jgi:GNAT superfamily N-acetyltransferase
LHIQLKEITRLDDDLLFPWLDLAQTAFPPYEHVLVSYLLQGIRSEQRGEEIHHRCLAAVDEEGQFAGMAWYEWYAEVAFLCYLAVQPGLRSQGTGTQMYQAILSEIRRQGFKVMLFEVEIPQSDDLQEQAHRRIAFYRRNGAKLLEGIHYMQDVGWHQPQTPMHIMIHALVPLDAQQAFDLVKGMMLERLEKVEELQLT